MCFECKITSIQTNINRGLLNFISQSQYDQSKTVLEQQVIEEKELATELASKNKDKLN